MTAVKLCLLVMNVRLIQGEAVLDVLLRSGELAAREESRPRSMVRL
jgi:hypothetical protein